MSEGVAAYFEDHKESSELGRLALRGGIVSVAMQYGNGALQIAAAIILARLLAPDDFGLVALGQELRLQSLSHFAVMVTWR